MKRRGIWHNPLSRPQTPELSAQTALSLRQGLHSLSLLLHLPGLSELKPLGPRVAVWVEGEVGVGGDNGPRMSEHLNTSPPCIGQKRERSRGQGLHLRPCPG